MAGTDPFDPSDPFQRMLRDVERHQALIRGMERVLGGTGHQQLSAVMKDERDRRAGDPVLVPVGGRVGLVDRGRGRREAKYYGLVRPNDLFRGVQYFVESSECDACEWISQIFSAVPQRSLMRN